jgi:Lrp/AsnC family leucine-responsive transcriptional regulator
VHVALERNKAERKFTDSVLKAPEIEECHHISGEFAFLIKLWARDLQDLERLINDRIKAHPGVVRIQTWIVLSSPKDQVTGLQL